MLRIINFSLNKFHFQSNVERRIVESESVERAQLIVCQCVVAVLIIFLQKQSQHSRLGTARHCTAHRAFSLCHGCQSVSQSVSQSINGALSVRIGHSCEFVLLPRRGLTAASAASFHTRMTTNRRNAKHQEQTYQPLPPRSSAS